MYGRWGQKKNWSHRVSLCPQDRNTPPHRGECHTRTDYPMTEHWGKKKRKQDRRDRTPTHSHTVELWETIDKGEKLKELHTARDKTERWLDPSSSCEQVPRTTELLGPPAYVDPTAVTLLSVGSDGCTETFTVSSGVTTKFTQNMNCS